MTCREFIEFLIDYESDDLPAAERARFDEHLAECPPCTAYLSTYRKTIALGRTAFPDSEDPVPEDVPPDLVKAILAARKAKK